MDEDTLNAAMRILNMAKVLESHGKLNRLMDMLGDCTEITWDNQCMVERFACESVFQNGVSDGDGLSEQAVGHAHSGIGPASERRTLCQPTVYAAGVELRQSFPHTGRFMWTRNTNRQAGTLSVRPAIKRQPKI